ncbi:hypothetical protein GBAR_LOCUS8910, partial [Geodia barretti]
MKEEKGALVKALELCKNLSVNLTHIESRPSVNNAGNEYDFFMDCKCEASVKEDFLSQLKSLALSVKVLARTPSEDEGTFLSYIGYSLFFSIPPPQVRLFLCLVYMYCLMPQPKYSGTSDKGP